MQVRCVLRKTDKEKKNWMHFLSLCTNPIIIIHFNSVSFTNVCKCLSSFFFLEIFFIVFGRILFLFCINLLPCCSHSPSLDSAPLPFLSVWWFLINMFFFFFILQIGGNIIVDLGHLRYIVDIGRIMLRWTGDLYHTIRRRLCIPFGCVWSACRFSSSLDCIVDHSANHSGK